MAQYQTNNKLLILLPRVPDVLDKGDKLRAFNQIKELSKYHQIYLICLDTEKGEKNLSLLKEFCSDIQVFKISKFSSFFNMSLCLFSSKPFQVGYFYNSTVKKKIQTYIKNLKPDHIFVQLIRTTEYVKDIHDIPKTLDFMDAFSTGIQRRLSSMSWLIKIFYQSEFHRLRKYESLMFDYFDNRTIISEVDRDLIFHSKKDEIHVVSNGVDVSFFDERDKYENEANILFTGNMAYPPNIKAADFITKELVPVLSKFNFIIAGSNPSPSLMARESSNIIVTGWVEDIKEYYLKGKIFCAPMFIGTGVQNKLLEAMAMGIPCVTTPLANKALGAVSEESVLIADDLDSFVKQINKLQNDKDLYYKIVNNARDFVRNNYSWSSSTKELSRLMNN